MGGFNIMKHEGMAYGIVYCAEQVQEYDMQNLAYTIGKLQFPKTFNHFLSN
jgi:hypothetical protein